MVGFRRVKLLGAWCHSASTSPPSLQCRCENAARIPATVVRVYVDRSSILAAPSASGRSLSDSQIFYVDHPSPSDAATSQGFDATPAKANALGLALAICEG